LQDRPDVGRSITSLAQIEKLVKEYNTPRQQAAVAAALGGHEVLPSVLIAGGLELPSFALPETPKRPPGGGGGLPRTDAAGKRPNVGGGGPSPKQPRSSGASLAGIPFSPMASIKQTGANSQVALPRGSKGSRASQNSCGGDARQSDNAVLALDETEFEERTPTAIEAIYPAIDIMKILSGDAQGRSINGAFMGGLVTRRFVSIRHLSLNGSGGCNIQSISFSDCLPQMRHTSHIESWCWRSRRANM
jgi:hypothetical protein